MKISLKSKLFLIALITLCASIYSVQTTHAQSCSGSITCCNDTATSCTNALGNSCLAGSPGCTCTTSCNSWDIPQSCTLNGNSCQVQNGCGYSTGSCTYNAPSTPAPTPPGSTPTPGSCNGSCVPVSSVPNNCGDIGRPDGAGSCSAGERCCGNFGGGGPIAFGCEFLTQNTTPPGSTIPVSNSVFSVGDRIQARADFDESNTDGLITRIHTRSLDTGIVSYNATVTPAPGNYLSESSIYTINPRGTALSTGTARIRTDVYGKRCPACAEELMCQRTPQITIQPGTVVMTPDPMILTAGEVQTATATVNVLDGSTIVSVAFSVNNGSTASVTPAVNAGGNVYTTQITGLAVGNTRSSVLVTTTTGIMTDDILVRVTTSSCATPVINPPVIGCISAPGNTGNVTWSWNAVPQADQYNFRVEDNLGNVVAGTSTGWADGLTEFSCRPDRTPADLCSQNVTSLPAGSYRSVVQARGSCGTSTATTSNIVVVGLCPTVAWWQAGNGHVITQGNIRSQLPASQSLIADGSGGYPGLSYRGAFGTLDLGSGVVSSKLWSVQSIHNARKPDYASFESLIPVSITPPDPGGNVSQFNTGGATTGDGYYWYKRGSASAPAALNISSDITLSAGRKVIVFVNGDVTISGNISLNPSNSFFILIATGNITVASSVTSLPGVPTLTGMFYTDRQFITVAGSGKLDVLGSVVATQGVSLNRDLAAGNATTPAESFTLSPELLLNYPAALTFKHPSWSEVAP